MLGMFECFVGVFLQVNDVLSTVSLSPFFSLACPLSLAVGDGGAAAQLDNHLLAVLESPLVSQFLQGASSVRQHAHPLARCRQEGGGKVAARQHHGLCLLTLAWSHLALLCRQKKTNKKNTEDCLLMHWRVGSPSIFNVISLEQPIRLLMLMQLTSHWLQ